MTSATWSRCIVCDDADGDGDDGRGEDADGCTDTKQYKLTLATTPAAVGISNLSGLATGGWYDDGSTASITAAADVDITAGASRYDFRNWSGASSATTLTATVTMDAAKTLTANYTKQYKLTLATTPAAVGISNLSGLATGGWYDDGSTASITAANTVPNPPGSQYHFSIWSGDSTATTLAASVVMSSPRSLTANYTREYFTTTAVSLTKIAPNASVQYSDQVTLSAVVTAVDPTGGSLSGSVVFKFNGVAVGSPVTVSGTSPQTVSTTLTLTAATVPSVPGSYSIAAAFTPIAASNYLASNSPPTNASVGQEDARSTYTGDMLAFTSGGDRDGDAAGDDPGHHCCASRSGLRRGRRRHPQREGHVHEQRRDAQLAARTSR